MTCSLARVLLVESYSQGSAEKLPGSCCRAFVACMCVARVRVPLAALRGGLSIAAEAKDPGSHHQDCRICLLSTGLATSGRAGTFLPFCFRLTTPVFACSASTPVPLRAPTIGQHRVPCFARGPLRCGTNPDAPIAGSVGFTQRDPPRRHLFPYLPGLGGGRHV